MKWVRFIVTAAITVALIYFFDNKLGDIPPVGKFFSPFTGFWQNNENDDIASEDLHIEGLKDEVIVHIDDNLVPHIFANNNYDLYFAQGYITAKYRLWQMEFQTMAAAGRVSEIVGELAVEYDRQQRRWGMAYGAERALKEMEADPQCKEATDAYTAGVNAYINSLSEKNLPVEYKVLNYRPEPWTPLKCALLLKYMTYDLAGYSDDFYVTNVLRAYGQETIDSLFVNRPYILDPTIPVGTKWDFSPQQLPPSPENIIAGVSQFPFAHQPDPDNGSNNWAVSGSKTKSGYPILCGDPHLGLNLPSIWYQVQLVSPDCNVTGASLPGTPTVIIGFNDHIAWSETNVDADVLDWYQIKFRDASLNEYFYNNEWKKTSKKIESIKVRGGKEVMDTVIYTHHGPVVAMAGFEPLRPFIPEGCAMRWLGHDGSVELKTFLKLNRAANYDEYVKALSFFSCPAQNFTYADNENNVATWVNGKYPLKWRDQGKFIMDGSNPANDWQGWISHVQDPHIKNPERGFVSSANQSPTDETYPYYLNWRFETFSRGYRINEVLSGANAVTADDMRQLQYDSRNVIAEKVLPAMLSHLDRVQMNDLQKEISATLSKWNFNADAGSSEQSVFEFWWNNLKTALWDEFGQDDMTFPETDVTMRTVVNGINQKWVDNIQTPQQETLTDLVSQSFTMAIDSLTEEFGSDWKKWLWSEVKGTQINHLLRIPAFSHMKVDAPGNKAIVNATGKTHGPSWRMIVELGKQPHAFGIYPGGQSGNPGSPYYDNMIEKWTQGEQNELVMLSSPDDKNARIISTLTLHHE